MRRRQTSCMDYLQIKQKTLKAAPQLVLEMIGFGMDVRAHSVRSGKR